MQGLMAKDVAVDHFFERLPLCYLLFLGLLVTGTRQTACGGISLLATTS